MQCTKSKAYNEANQKLFVKHKHFQFFHCITSNHHRICHQLFTQIKNTENATR